jgi:hypothetical protein
VNDQSINDKTTNIMLPKIEICKAKQTVIDVSTYPDVVEKVQNAICLEPNFSNNKELADAIEITNEHIMSSMALYSLANRVKSYFFKRGYYAGYIARLKEEDSHYTSNDVSRNLLIRAREKAKSSREAIRVMKNMIKIYDRVMSFEPNTIEGEKVSKAVGEALEREEEIKSSVVKRIFRPGDLQQSPTLRKILSALHSKETITSL